MKGDKDLMEYHVIQMIEKKRSILTAHVEEIKQKISKMDIPEAVTYVNGIVQ